MDYKDNIIFLSPEERQHYLLIKNGYDARQLFPFQAYPLPDFNIYLLKDRRIVAVDRFSPASYILPSLDFLLEALQEYQKVGKKSHELIASAFPYDEDFLLYKEELLEQLPNMLEISMNSLDFSIESLNEIDTKLKKVINGRTKIELCSPLIAYCGELISKCVNGKWFMQEYIPSIPGIWRPFITDNSQNIYNPFRAIFRRLFDTRTKEDIEENGGEESHNLYGLVKVEILTPIMLEKLQFKTSDHSTRQN